MPLASFVQDSDGAIALHLYLTSPVLAASADQIPMDKDEPMRRALME